ncbi:MAG: photosynthetic reaction center cytochrome PufC [Ideonella sp.]|nr:photosynthetic reaction center cytochrome PufC [Ideonella sp.]
MNFIRLSVSLLGLCLLASCERPPVDTVQRGYRGTGMEQVYNPRTLATQAELNTAPEALPEASADGPKARDVYQNVKVLGDLSVAQFARTMSMMTASVSPKESCLHCHNPQNFADDSLYTKVVARRMLQMTQSINTDWKKHVGTTGVTCYTCHRGNNVPQETWFKPLMPKGANTFAGDKAGQNSPAAVPALASLPIDPFTPFLLGSEEIRVQGNEALPSGNQQSTKQAEWTYSLMTHMSKSLGVNCTQCHNTRAFGSWENSSPPRLTAWQGIRMARSLNNDFLVPLTDTFPAHRLGAGGDVAKVNCATCHQGAHKPLYGAPMAAAYPELLKKSSSAAATPSAPAAASAASAASAAVAAGGEARDMSAMLALEKAMDAKAIPVVAITSP